VDAASMLSAQVNARHHAFWVFANELTQVAVSGDCVVGW
jgi:hypothetical protein